MFNDYLAGASEFAHQIEACNNSAVVYLYTSGTASQIPALLKEIESAWRTADKEGWDGKNTKAISYSTKLKAEQFVQSLPIGMKNSPVVLPEGDGAIGFDWSHGKESLTILIKEGRLVYSAFLKDDERSKGSLRFRQKLPQELADLISYFNR